MKKIFLVLLLFVCGCKTDWHEKAYEAELKGNKAKAFQYYKKGAEQGDCLCMPYMAKCYAKGLYVEQNTQKAEQIFTELVEKSLEDKEYSRKCFSYHLYEIGVAFLEGEEIPRDYEKAFYWTSKAVEWGNQEALSLLAGMYAYGWGTEKDVEKARDLFRNKIDISEEKNKYFGRYDIGLFYLQSYDPPEYKKAFDYFIKVVEDSDADLETVGDAMYQIALLFLSDNGIGYNPEKGEEWFEKAVKNYEKLTEYTPKYMWDIGQWYETGPEEIQNMDKAIYWYQQAADSGWEQAKEKLKELAKGKN